MNIVQVFLCSLALNCVSFLAADATPGRFKLHHYELLRVIGLLRGSVLDPQPGMLLSAVDDDYGRDTNGLWWYTDELTGAIRTDANDLCVQTNDDEKLMLAECGTNSWRMECLDNCDYTFTGGRWVGLVLGGAETTDKKISLVGTNPKVWNGTIDAQIQTELVDGSNANVYVSQNFDLYSSTFGAQHIVKTNSEYLI